MATILTFVLVLVALVVGHCSIKESRTRTVEPCPPFFPPTVPEEYDPFLFESKEEEQAYREHQRLTSFANQEEAAGPFRLSPAEIEEAQAYVDSLYLGSLEHLSDWYGKDLSALMVWDTEHEVWNSRYTDYAYEWTGKKWELMVWDDPSERFQSQAISYPEAVKPGELPNLEPADYFYAEPADDVEEDPFLTC